MRHVSDLLKCTTLTLLCGPLIWLHGQETGPTTPPAKTFAAEPATEQKTLIGFTRAGAEISVISEFSGRCLEVAYDIGDTIGEKTVFARLDDTFTQLELKANGVEQENLTSTIRHLEKSVRRAGKLLERETYTESRFEDIEQELRRARFQLESLKVREAVLNEQLKRLTINVPSGWRVSERTIEPGAWVTMGMPVGKVGDYRTLHVPLALDPAEFEWLESQAGAVPLRLIHNDAVVSAEVARVSPAFDPQTRKINVELAVPANAQVNRGGIRMALDIQLPMENGAISAPLAALEKRYDEYWLTRENGLQVRVTYLGRGRNDTARVVSPEVQAGQRFLIKSE